MKAKYTRRAKSPRNPGLSIANKIQFGILLVAGLGLLGGVTKHCWSRRQSGSKVAQIKGQGTALVADGNGIVGTIRGDGTIIGDVNTVMIDKRNGLDPQLLLQKTLELTRANALLEATLKEHEERAIARVQQIEAEGNSEAKRALEEYRKKGDTAKLLALLLEERDRIRQEVRTQTEKLVDLDRQITSVAFRRRDVPVAAEAVERLLAASPNDSLGLYVRSALSLLRGSFGEAEADIRYALRLAVDANDKQAEATALNGLGLIYCAMADWKRGEEMTLQALRTYKETGNMRGTAMMYGNLVAVYAGKDDWKKAEESAFKAFAMYEELGDSEGMATAGGSLGLLHARKGDWEKAKEMFRKALESHRETGLKEGIVNQSINLGSAYLNTGDLKEAERTLEGALEIATGLGYVAIADVYSLLGVVRLKQGNMAKSESMLSKAITLHQGLADRRGMAFDYSNLGVLYQNCGYFEKAEQMHIRSLELHENLGDKRGVAKNYANLGSVYRTKGDVDEARRYWHRSLELFKEFPPTDDVEQVQAWLRKLDGQTRSDRQ
jgi:tetratricopeptide (TPR) repeat protein